MGSVQSVDVYVLSDGTGDTAAAVARAAMLQFHARWRLRTFSGIRDEAMVRRVVASAEAAGALVAFTLVDRHVAKTLREEASRRGVPTVDVLGPFIASVSAQLHVEPRSEPGLLHGISDEYFRRIEAVEFAVRHDDGANLHTLFGADLVLTGVSRTSKTPLSMYLAQRGYKTGNVPIVPALPPPRALLEMDPGKVVGLTTDRGTLLSVREARARGLGAPYAAYADPAAVEAELRQARRIFRERGWRVIDVSGRAVEENAARILQLLGS